MKQFHKWLLGLIVVSSLARLIALETSPPGFYIDEAGDAVNAICVAQTGAGELGDRWPLFFPAFDRHIGGFFTAPVIYPMALWSSILGTSPAVFRSFVAVSSIFMIYLLILLGTYLWDFEAGLFIALTAALSPWLFQFSRIGWDPAIACFLLVAAVYVFVRFEKMAGWISAGFLLALAAYAYAPMRAQIALFLPALFYWQYRRGQLDKRAILFFLGSAFIFALPLIKATLSGELQGRFQMLSVFSPYFLSNQYHSTSRVYGILAFLKNIAAHFSPGYLFLSGDRNLRHSTQDVGILGWVDDLAIVLFIVECIRTRLFKDWKMQGTLLLAFWGFVTGIVAASLTWEGIPHALRSFGGAPFLVLATGLMLRWTVNSSAIHRGLLVCTAIAFMAYFGWAYFVDYPQ